MQETIRHINERQGSFYRLLLFLLCVGVLVFLMPVDTKFQYDYAEGRVWKYEDLYAPFDYVIHKPEDSVQVERAKIEAENIPYYRLDKEVADLQLEAFDQALRKNWDSCSFSMAQIGGVFPLNKSKKDSLESLHHYEVAAKLMDKVFDAGIIQWEESHENRGQDAEIYFLNGSRAKTLTAQDLRDMQEAYAYIEKKLSKMDDVDQDFLLEHISNALQYNVLYDEAKTTAELNAQLEGVLSNIGKVTHAEKIIGKGEVVDGRKFLKLESFRSEYQKQLGGSKDYWIVLAGHFLLISLCILSLYIFLRLFRKDVLYNTKSITFLLLLVALMGFLTHLTGRLPNIDLYIMPLCLLPIIIRAFFDAELALFVHIVTVLAVSFMVPDQFTFIFLHLIAGVVAVFSIVNLRKRSQFFVSVALIFGAYVLAWFGLAVVEAVQLDQLNYERIAWLGGNAALTLFSFPLIFVFEKLFGFVSETTLMELSDTNTPLLRELTTTAPGTFQHTIQVANLAEAAVHAIGGSTLLVRTGALYHDIGKMKNPMYFIENQKGTNPHDELGSKESSKIIVQHVLDGIELAKKHNLPDQIIDFIRTHHGTTRTEYFYRTYLKENGLESMEDDSMFRYPGPLPYSKETAVLMMADSVEAASRSLKDYSAKTIEGLVNGIIDHQMSAGQFSNADITFRDISTIKSIFVKQLMNVYHVRIEYPK